MVHDHRADYASEWPTVEAIASKLGYTSETLRRWVRQAQTDSRLRDGVTIDERERMRALEREVQELRRANEILCGASAYFAQAEFNRRGK
jgi:transposase